MNMVKRRKQEKKTHKKKQILNKTTKNGIWKMLVDTHCDRAYVQLICI